MENLFIAPLQAVPDQDGLPGAAPGVATLGATSGAAAPGFGEWIVKEAGMVNRQLLAAEAGIRQVVTGEAPSLHEVMIRLEEARHALQLLAQVRNRLLEAYQEVMRTQV